MDTICISLGGAIVSKRTGVNVSYIKKFLRLLEDSDKKYIIVVGGGYASRLYIQSSRPTLKNNAVLDEIAIAITRINALIVKDMLSGLDVYPNIVTSLDELRTATKNNRIVVMGGLLPGMSTDAVTVLACEVVGGKMLINLSNGSYVYDRPPSDPKAKKLESLTHNELVTLAAKYDTREAGSHFIFDLVASKLAKRAGIEVMFVNDNVSELKLAIGNKKHSGSTVKG